MAISIAFDAMGGDFAPRAAVEGAVMARQELSPETHLILLGDKPSIDNELTALGVDANAFTIVHTSQVIGMAESPTKALREKPESSIAIGLGMVKAGKVKAFASAGNTGAVLAGSLFIVKAIEGIFRPTLVGYFPNTNGGDTCILDVGANLDVKPDVLEQFAELGMIFARDVMGKTNPRVGLLNVGEEEGKGSDTLKLTYQALKANTKINFIGNIEGGDLLIDKADVLVCDGLVGNVLFKSLESVYEIMADLDLPLNNVFGRMNYEAIGGMPILGVEGNVIVGHGRSTPLAMMNMILQTERIAVSDLAVKIKSSFHKQP